MNKDIFVQELLSTLAHEKRAFSSCFYVLDKRMSDGKQPHKFILRDRTGDISAISWPSNKKIDWLEISNSTYAWIDGDVIYNSFSHRNEVSVNNLMSIDKDEINLAYFIPTGPLNRKQLFLEVIQLIKSINNDNLKTLLTDLFSEHEFSKRYREAPAAQKKHHSYLGGLLEHSLEVAKLCDAVSLKFDDLNRDILVAAALLHDVGKIDEIDYSTPEFGMTLKGGMLGHVFLGTKHIHNLISKQNNCPDGLVEALCHLLISHHGELEWGVPIQPCFIEAYILHLCDQISVKRHFFNASREAIQSDKLFHWNADLKRLAYSADFSWTNSEQNETSDILEELDFVSFEELKPKLKILDGGLVSDFLNIPLMGSVAAGIPNSEERTLDERITLSSDSQAKEGDYLLKVRGDSMIDAHIVEGDLVLVRPNQSVSNKDIVVVLIDGENTVKYFYRENGKNFLRAANPTYDDIPLNDESEIQGKVIGVMRGIFQV